MDSKLFDTPDFPGIWVLGEYKTHNDKSFRKVKKEGVKKAKPEHYVQMQIYMHYGELPFALYFAVNKNDDELYIEIVEYDRETAIRFIDRGGQIIYATEPPPRISESESWYVCRFCDHKEICHRGQPKDKNCRTCVHSKPVADAAWLCTKFNYYLSEQEQRRGCLEHEEIRE